MTANVDVETLADVLAEWPDLEPPESAADGAIGRLASALRSLHRGGPVGYADLGVLVRDVMRRVDESRSDGSHDSGQFTLLVPRDPPWPTLEQWRDFGIEPRERGTRLLLRSVPWTPDWLAGSTEPVDTPVMRSELPDGIRRHFREVPADPFLSATFPMSGVDFSVMTSAGHQQALRTVMSSRPGATIVVSLPTGAGKSTVVLAPAFVWGRPSGVTVVVVPTVALALDQERRVRELLSGVEDNGVYAYTAGLDLLLRAEVRRRLRDGTQTVVFVSPESFTNSLVPALFDAAERGHLKMFAIDEAHLVDQWGSDFRPHYQAMAGLRAALLEAQTGAGHQPFRTVLMTATLPAPTLQLLSVLFGDQGRFELVNASVLRPEPAYWLKSCDTHVERLPLVLDALHHLPRPALLYVTEVKFSRQWGQELAASGYRRFKVFTGETGDDERRAVLQAFRNGDIDLVVGTSAFGLGVDQANVRTIVHACVPETVDRYYQEVGRAGRDGRASIAVLVHTERDLGIARSLGKQAIIGIELGLDRWETMLANAESLGDDRYRVPVDIVRAGLDRQSDENTLWNVRTLNLMARAGLISMWWERPKMIESEGVEVFDDGPASAIVKLLHAGHADRSTWERVIGPIRDEISLYNERAHDRMVEILRQDRPICDVLIDAYSLPAIPEIGEEAVRPHRSCGGCGHCRTRPPRSGDVPVRPPVRWPLETAPSFGGRPLITASYPRPRTDREVAALIDRYQEFLRIAVGAGARVLVGDRFFTSTERVPVLSRLHLANAARLFLVQQFDKADDVDLDRLPSLPSVFVAPFVGGADKVPQAWLQLYEGDAPRIVLVPDDTSHPTRPDRKLIDLEPAMTTMELMIEDDTWRS